MIFIMEALASTTKDLSVDEMIAMVMKSTGTTSLPWATSAAFPGYWMLASVMILIPWP